MELRYVLSRQLGIQNLCESPSRACPMEVDTLTWRWKPPDVVKLYLENIGASSFRRQFSDPLFEESSDSEHIFQGFL